MLAAIDAARAYVLLEMYLVETSAIVDAFHRCAAAGARRGVRVCVLFDGFGALRLRRVDRRRLTDGGVELRFFNPLRAANGFANLLRDHRKLLLTDGLVAYVGGAGLTDAFAPGVRGGPWRDVMVEIKARWWPTGNGLRAHLAALRGGARARGARRRYARSHGAPAGCH